ncbi:MAG: RNA polymerase sigma factor [Candidatus Omnitrophica bacterium]|nr:RNA polymerase sigma factor [Candidatus Omnitrophota bacterium]
MDEKILEILIQNGMENFEEFVRRYERMVYGIAYRFLNNHQDAEDVTQETFLIAFRKLKELKKSGSLNAWVYKIALNATREVMRKKQRKKKLMDNITHQPRIPITSVGESVTMIDINVILDKLSSQQKKVIELRYLKELKIKEISKILGCTTGTVKTHIFRGLKILKGVMQNGDL